MRNLQAPPAPDPVLAAAPLRATAPAMSRVEFVRQMQSHLNSWIVEDRGVHPTRHQALLLQDGNPGRNTKSALAHFQQAHRLRVTSKFDQPTIAALQTYEPYEPPTAGLEPALAQALKELPIYRELRAPEQPMRFIVLHDTEGPTALGAVTHLGLNTASGNALGYHYLIDRSGKTIELVDPRFLTAHALSSNQGSIAISFVGGHSWGKITSAQLDSAQQLIAALKERYDTLTHILGHKHTRFRNQRLCGKHDPDLIDSALEALASRTGLVFDSSGKEMLAYAEQFAPPAVTAGNTNRSNSKATPPAAKTLD